MHPCPLLLNTEGRKDQHRLAIFCAREQISIFLTLNCRNQTNIYQKKDSFIHWFLWIKWWNPFSENAIWLQHFNVDESQILSIYFKFLLILFPPLSDRRAWQSSKLLIVYKYYASSISWKKNSLCNRYKRNHANLPSFLSVLFCFVLPLMSCLSNNTCEYQHFV